METDRDLYQILQIDPAAEPEVVQAAFKRLALKYHPDRNSAPDAHSRMQELNEAYTIINDPPQRAAYDVLRRENAQAQRRAEDQARQQAEAERRAEATRQRKEQMSAQRRAESERQAEARTAADQRRIEYEQMVRAQQAAQQRAKREKQQRAQETQQAATPPVEPFVPPIAIPFPEPMAMPEEPVEDFVDQNPIEQPHLSDCERRKFALMQSQRALQNEIFKLDYGITDAAEQVNYWSQRWFPWQIDVRAGQDTQFMIGGALTIVALQLAGFMLTLGNALGWAAAFGLVGIGVGGWTWRTSMSIMPTGHLVEIWTEIKRWRESQRQKFTEELAQLEAIMQVSAANVDNHSADSFNG